MILRVTQILRLAGLVDFSGIAPDVLEAARQRGTDVHSWIDGYHFGTQSAPEPEIARYCEAYLDWTRCIGHTVLYVEKEVESAKYRYRGRLDLIATINGEQWVIDVKTTASVPQIAALQLAGYALCLDEPHRRGVLHLRADGWKLVEFPEKSDVHDWLACVRIAHWKLRNGMGGVE